MEGAEIFAVETMDWARFPVHVLIIENRARKGNPNTDTINRILLANGFVFYDSQGRDNLVFVNPANAAPRL